LQMMSTTIDTVATMHISLFIFFVSIIHVHFSLIAVVGILINR
jgi:hypothetical protein